MVKDMFLFLVKLRQYNVVVFYHSDGIQQRVPRFLGSHNCPRVLPEEALGELRTRQK